MNSPVVRWLLDLETIPEGAGDLRLAWEHAWPGWVWTLLLFAAALIAIWSYSGLTGRRPVRGALALVRLGIVLLALALLAGPMIELPRETVEPDWVMMLVDRSASMTIADAPGDDAPDGVARQARDLQLAGAIDEHAALWRSLAEERQVHWLGFHDGVFSLETDAGVDADGAPTVRVDAGPPSGRRTQLDTALQQALQRAAARPISGIVVFSDGRTSDPPSRALMRRLQAEAVPVFTVPLGSPDPVGDLALRAVNAPRRAFIRDKVPVVVEVDRFGGAGGSLGSTVKLVDTDTGETLDAVELPAGDPREQVTLTAEPQLAGETSWAVVIETEQPDLIPDNNSAPLTIELVDRPLRVLFVDGYPRWEYRYLKNLLVREKSIESSIMLLSADRDFAQEGNEPITRLPRSPEELARYDVILLGDTPASFFSPDQLEMVRAHVSERGAGVLWIGGERAMPASYAGTVLADLLPIRGSLDLAAIGTPVTMAPTAQADRLGILQLVSGEEVGWPRELLDPAYGWSQLRYAQRIEPGRLKPTAEVLAQTAMNVDGRPLPLVIHMRYGAGQSIYVASDEIWRWRLGRGELLPDQFWIQMIRMLGRESLDASGELALLQVNPRRVEPRQPIRVTLRLLDARLVDARRMSIAAVLETEDGRPVAEIVLRPLPGSEEQYGATYLPETTGRLRVRIDDPTLPELRLVMPVEVFAPDDELRRPETDHGLLTQLARATGGQVLSVDDVGSVAELLPNRSVRTLNPLRERIWDTPLAFALVLLLLTGEWIGRKILRLV